MCPETETAGDPESLLPLLAHLIERIVYGDVGVSENAKRSNLLIAVKLTSASISFPDFPLPDPSCTHGSLTTSGFSRYARDETHQVLYSLNLVDDQSLTPVTYI